MNKYRLLRRVIVTGPDGCGKSTLIKRLTQDPEGPSLQPFVGHDGGPPLTIEEVWARLNRFMSVPSGIIDRCVAVDEPVYSQLLRRDTPVETNVFDEWLKSANPYIIYVTTANANISQEAKTHKPKSLTAAVQENYFNLRTIYTARMQHLMVNLGLQVVLYDYTVDPDGEGLVDLLRYHDVILDEKELH